MSERADLPNVHRHVRSAAAQLAETLPRCPSSTEFCPVLPDGGEDKRLEQCDRPVSTHSIRLTSLLDGQFSGGIGLKTIVGNGQTASNRVAVAAGVETRLRTIDCSQMFL